jgi:hypothetical protein
MSRVGVSVVLIGFVSSQFEIIQEALGGKPKLLYPYLRG